MMKKLLVYGIYGTIIVPFVLIILLLLFFFIVPFFAKKKKNKDKDKSP